MVQKKKKLKIKFKESAKLVEKKDKTIVQRPDTVSYPKMPTKPVQGNAANFKIKIRRKKQ